jgi:hypothetical protein
LNKPRILRITRPYETVEDYIASEGWTISSKRMILLDQPRLERDTLVRFELSLQSGEKLIRAEARVVGYQAPTPDKPGGPKVRFKRFGGTTKAFIQSVVSEFGPGPGLDTVHPSSPHGSDPIASDAPMSLSFMDSAASMPSLQVPRSQSLNVEALELDNIPVRPASLVPAHARTPNLASAEGSETSAPARQRLQRRLEGMAQQLVSVPTNRDALLERLRVRARTLPEQRATNGEATLADSRL